MTGTRVWPAWRRRALVAVAGLALLMSLAGCTGGSDETDRTPSPAPAEPPAVGSPLDDCAPLAAPPPEAQAAADGEADDLGPLPELSLPCLTGEEPVTLSQLRGPAVVNLWASWCDPCRAELPVLQDFADDTAGRVHVVGVITRDTRTAAAAFAADAGVTFPGVYDREGQLHRELPGMSLPVTLFVDADGQVRHLHQLPVDADELEALAAEHLGVTR